MKRLSLSKVEHASSCKYPFRADVDVPGSPPNEFAVAGTELGEAIHALINGLPIPELCDRAATFFDRWCQAYDLPSFGICMSEASFAFNTVTGETRWLGMNIGRDYAGAGQTSEEICGSIDLACMKDGVLTVYDWKSGRQHYLTRFKNPQVRGYAAILARHLGVDFVRAVIVVVDEDGVKEYPDEMYRVDIDDTLTYIMGLDEEIELLSPEPVAGPHCKKHYCGLAATCPALVTVSQEITKPALVQLRTKEDVGVTVAKLIALEAQAEAIWKLVDARAEELGEDCPVPGGRMYGLKASSREYIRVSPEARRLLEAKLGAEAVEESVKISITKESIKQGVKKAAPKGKAAAMEREILGELRDLGVVGVSESLAYGIK